MDVTIIVALVGFGGIAIGKAVDLLIDRLKRRDGKQDKELEKHNEILTAIKVVSDSVTKLEKTVADVSYNLSETATVQCRVRILRFADEIVHGVHHSRDHYEQTMEDINQYTRFCEQFPSFKNEITVASISLIRDTYSERLKNNDFL